MKTHTPQASPTPEQDSRLVQPIEAMERAGERGSLYYRLYENYIYAKTRQAKRAKKGTP